MKQFDRKDQYESTFFQPEEKKLYTIMIGDGVQVKVSDEGKKSLAMPFICVNDDNQQFNYTVFIPDVSAEDWQKAQTERELNEIADCCGVWDQVAKAVSGDDPITCDQGLKELTLRLPGRVFEAKFRIAQGKDKTKAGFPRFIYKAKVGTAAKGGEGKGSGGNKDKNEVWD